MVKDQSECNFGAIEMHFYKLELKYVMELWPFKFSLEKHCLQMLLVQSKHTQNSRLDFLPLSRDSVLLYCTTTQYHMRTFSMVVTPRFTFWHITTTTTCVSVYRSRQCRFIGCKCDPTKISTSLEKLS